jgi:hypothetical protein
MDIGITYLIVASVTVGMGIWHIGKKNIRLNEKAIEIAL